jgi:hypothetical protein
MSAERADAAIQAKVASVSKFYLELRETLGKHIQWPLGLLADLAPNWKVVGPVVGEPELQRGLLVPAVALVLALAWDQASMLHEWSMHE